MRKYLFTLLAFTAIGAFPLVSGASIKVFESSAGEIESGGAAVLAWQTTDAGGVMLEFPCENRGIHYKNSDGSSINCGEKVKGLPANGSFTVVVVNTAGNITSIAPKITQVNPDGSESQIVYKMTFSVKPDPNPIIDFSTPSLTVKSGEEFLVSWTAPEVDALNMTLSCPDEVTPTLVGDDRPRIPCNLQPIFLYDLKGSGTSSFKMINSLREPSIITLNVAPKTSSGSYDGSRGKMLKITVRGASVSKDPVITSFRLGDQTLKSGQETSVMWSVDYGPGVNMKMTCAKSAVATSSLTGSSPLPCSGFMFPNMLPGTGSFIISFATRYKSEELDLTLVPAVEAGLYDTKGERSARIVVLNELGLDGTEKIAPPAVPVLAPVLVPAPATPAPAAVVPAPIPAPVQVPSSSVASVVAAFAKPLAYGIKNDPDVRKMQEVLKSVGVYGGEATGNFLSITREAVKKFQAKYGIPAIGVVGPQTIAKLNEVAKTTGVEVSPLPAQASPKATAARIIGALRKGSRGGEVTLLQKILASDAAIYPEGTISGFFGPATEAAVKKFQAKHGMDTVGFVGPGTRKKLNEIALEKGVQ